MISSFDKQRCFDDVNSSNEDVTNISLEIFRDMCYASFDEEEGYESNDGKEKQTTHITWTQRIRESCNRIKEYCSNGDMKTMKLIVDNLLTYIVLTSNFSTSQCFSIFIILNIFISLYADESIQENLNFASSYSHFFKNKEKNQPQELSSSTC